MYINKQTTIKNAILLKPLTTGLNNFIAMSHQEILDNDALFFPII